VFLNFLLDQKLWPFVGLDFEPYLDKLEQGAAPAAWMQWDRRLMGLKSSPYDLLEWLVRRWHACVVGCCALSYPAGKAMDVVASAAVVLLLLHCHCFATFITRNERRCVSKSSSSISGKHF